MIFCIGYICVFVILVYCFFAAKWYYISNIPITLKQLYLAGIKTSSQNSESGIF